jgi:hypothetical protein
MNESVAGAPTTPEISALLGVPAETDSTLLAGSPTAITAATDPGRLPTDAVR